ncbi:Dual-specificity kinase, spindle pole body (SPB) duplication and spindle checkpoint function [Mortierella hygrophila]|uniref:Dual-specificity kinase, spindle pole body (SPB) duplication and spindle checkpoint function n=1 Tax=Mortierella hygrophila TaxID=979708 RepID=A0A9P6JYQ1_9FUNG|nr:Dual-specificity kinase, spindle pole body (SPB) duplication and spindle checkpoint function [Mortierella hygrophila]
MTDLESREKKRGPPPKLQPINIGQPKDKEAHLADYFGEGSLPFATTQSLNIRPTKRTIFSKVTTNTNINTNISSHSVAIGTATSNTNTRDTPGSNSNNASVSFDLKDSSSIQQPSAATTLRSGHHIVTASSDRESGTEAAKSSQSLGNANITDTASEPMILHRVRSSSRLSRQEPFQKKEFTSPPESDKPALTEVVSTISEPKVAFAPPPSRISRNPEGKENLTPRTSLTSRSYLRKSIPSKSTALRKSFNWGPAQREVGESADKEETKGSTSNDDERAIPPTVEQNTDTAAATVAVASGATVPSTPDDSGTSSVDLALQDLQVDDAAAGSGTNSELARGRQGVKRDMDEAGSSAKRRKEFHPQEDSSRLDIKRTSFGTLPSPPSPRLNTTVPSHASEQFAFTNEKPKSSEEATPVQRKEERESIERKHAAPKSPQAIKAAFHFPPLGSSQPSSNPPAQQQQHQQQQQQHLPQPSQPPQQQRPQHGDGIASIVQNLVVGAPKTNPRPSVNQSETQGRSGSGTMSPPFTTASLSVNTSSSRGDLGYRSVMMVNNRPYTKLAQVGKGGSSKVYKVLASNSRVLALKKVSFENADQSTINGYVNEIRLLRRMVNSSRIIRLWDAEVNNAKGYLSLVMEFGEIDLAHMLQNQQTQPFDLHFIGLYWRQMLEAVQVVHDLKIVHSDLKPANFLLVGGSLKLIDFGIANAIANDTTNIHREGQFGTANYMSPEAISSNPQAGGCRKLGRPSDVWSLGCILYQMVYGKSPFSDVLNVFQKLNVITNPDYQIKFTPTVRSPLRLGEPQSNPLPPAPPSAPGATGGDGSNTGSTSLGSDTSSSLPDSTPTAPTIVDIDPNLIRVMKGCLAYNVSDRLTIPDLLADPFLHPYISASPDSSSPLSSSSEARIGTGTKESVMMDIDTLHQVMQASMVFAANHVTSQGNGSSGNSSAAVAIDKVVVQSATEQVWRQLQAEKKADSTTGGGSRFFISD